MPPGKENSSSWSRISFKLFSNLSCLLPNIVSFSQTVGSSGIVRMPRWAGPQSVVFKTVTQELL